MLKGLKNINVVTPSGIKKQDISIRDGQIHSLEDQLLEGLSFTEDVLVVPGFIDIHIHGANEVDVMDACCDSLRQLSKALVKEGTTAYLTTTMTQSIGRINQALESVNMYIKEDNQEGAEVLGVHLEGPFINPLAKGAQNDTHIIPPSVDVFKTFFEKSGFHIKVVTIAPEVEGGYELIEYCRENGVIPSIGHTKASYKEVLKAIQSGAKLVTHCFNAMSPLHHRDVGVVGGAFLHDELTTELIADGIHVSEQAIKLLYKNKGVHQIILVTDSIRAKGLSDGEYELGGQTVYVKNGKATLRDNTLAGSVLKMNDAVSRMMRVLNISIEDVVCMASSNPAKILGVYDRKGSIEVGKDADFVVLNKDYEIIMTICKGRVEYQKGE